MTVYGPDGSKWQAGITVDQPDTDAVGFVIARASIGENTDNAHRVAYSWAVEHGKSYAGYHFVYETSKHTATAQAATWHRSVGDLAVPCMLDVESDGTERPQWTDVVAVAEAIRSIGYRVTLAYLPHWYWQQIGSPQLTDAGLDIVSSDYGPNHVGEADTLYEQRGGDTGSGWNGYGGLDPVLWQFGSQVAFGDQLVDMNAYRGDPARLGDWLLTPANTPDPAPTPVPEPTEDDDMNPFIITNTTTGQPALVYGDGRTTGLAGEDLLAWVERFGEPLPANDTVFGDFASKP